MKYSIILILTLCLGACSPNNKSETLLIANYGDQPFVATGSRGEISLVFGDKESIYITQSNDDGNSFDEPQLVAKLEGMSLGYSSGPTLAITATGMIVTAMDKEGNYYAWNKLQNEMAWDGPVRINDLDGSSGETLGDITSAPNGYIYTVWIDTRKSMAPEHKMAKPEAASHEESSQEPTAVDLNKMTPKGITVGELYEIIGDIPDNAHLAFFSDKAEENILWVLRDSEGNVLKAEDIDEYHSFKARNGEKEKPKGKIYMSSSADNGKTWLKSWLVYQSPAGSVCECCKPSITSDDSGKLTIMFRNNVDGSRDMHFTSSEDGGVTFSKPEKLGTGTWKINGCPMDGGALMVDSDGSLNTIWQREGEIFIANSSKKEELVGSGRSPSIAFFDKQVYKTYVSSEEIMLLRPESTNAVKIGSGMSPKLIATSTGVLCLWVSKEGIIGKKI